MRMRKIKNKQPFTLLEICLCVALLALISGFLGFKILSAVSLHRFESNVSAIVADLKRAQALALSYQSEFRVKIFEHKGRFEYLVTTDEPKSVMKRLPHEPLRGISSLSSNKQEIKSLSLRITSSGRIEPLSVIGFHTKDEARWIDLRHPLQIKLSSSYPDKK
jgi:hypothetical protein